MTIRELSNEAILEPRLPPLPLRIYVNRNLRMDTVRAIGFDMDYTLARYRRELLEELAHRLTVDKLLQRGYPEAIRDFRYDPSFVIRGLTVDKQLGNIIKLDRHNHSSRVFHGRRRLPKTQRRNLYHREKIHFVPPRFAMVDTLFSLPEMCLYADLVDYFDRISTSKISTWQLFDDTRECIDAAHRDNSLKTIVKADLAKYVEKEPLLSRTLHKLRSSGKRLFLLTNSLWDYTNSLMSYLLDNELAEYPVWTRYFDAIIVGANKPDFFTGNEPFAELDASGTAVRRPAPTIEKGKVYQGGNLRDFERIMGMAGEDVLYVGDHIYGDILRSKKASLWRTVMVVEELEDEIRHTMDHQDDLRLLYALENRRRDLDDSANLQRQRLAYLERKTASPNAEATAEFTKIREERDVTKKELKHVIHEIELLQSKLDRGFNANWGMIFKEGHENSRFGEQVKDYACLYTSRVSNFLGYSTFQYFRSPRDTLPHERE